MEIKFHEIAVKEDIMKDTSNLKLNKGYSAVGKA
jgi:hypothetical protein